MQFLVLIILVVAFALVSARFGWRTSHNMGANIGENYMKEHWNTEPEKRRREDD